MPDTVTGSDFVHPVRFENQIKVGNASAGQEETPAPFVNLRGLFTKTSGHRGLDSGYDALVNEYEVYCYWRSQIESFINKDTRIIYDNKEFTIISYERIGERRQYFHFKVAEFH